MLISHHHGFVFLRTRKTAGTSIELALSSYAGPDDVVTSTVAGEEHLVAEYGGSGAQNTRIPMRRWRPWHWYRAAAGRPIRFSTHMTAETVRRFVGRRVWKEYFTFAVDRNPWDLAVSAYAWHHRPGRRAHRTFEDFVLNGDLALYSTWNVYGIGHEVAVDKLIRYDDLEAELAEVTDKLGLPPVMLPRAKASYRGDRRRYQDWYTDESRQRVADVFRREINYFGWTFD